MIARTWSGRVPAHRAEAYFAYLQETGIPDLEATPGNLGVYVLRRAEGDSACFTMISLWRSEEAIRAFAGADLERARYYPEDADFLLELEPRVRHHEILWQPGSVPDAGEG